MFMGLILSCLINFMRRLNRDKFYFFKVEFSNLLAYWGFEVLKKYKISAQYL